MCGLCHNISCGGVEHHQDPTIITSAAVAVSDDTTSQEQIINQLNRGDFSWNGASPITFSFATALPTYAVGDAEYVGFGRFNDQQMDMARLALSTWEDVANITFWETTSQSAKISFANSSTLADYSAAHAYFPAYSAWGGDVWINSDLAYNTAPEVGGYGFKVLVHEIGHAIGQPHPGDYNADGGSLSYAKNAAYAEDSKQFTIMSYWDEAHTGADFGDYSAQTPMLHDILAIQAKYGINWATRSDDTVYGFNSNTDSPIFDFSLNEHPVLSIWDGGGTDTLDLSGFADDTVLDLNPGSFSSVAGLVNNISIAFGAAIENATTGSGDDIVIGNVWDNIVDTGSGNDTFWVNVDMLDANTCLFNDGRLVVYSDDGTDQITNVESLKFNDAEIDVLTLAQHSILEYAATYDDLAAAFGTNEEMLFKHFIELGLAEGRKIEFSALDYIASNRDLIESFGADIEAGARHYIEFGRAEQRTTVFDHEAFFDANPDLVNVSGINLNAAQLYIDL